jgi:hypothetical protein
MEVAGTVWAGPDKPRAGELNTDLIQIQIPAFTPLPQHILSPYLISPSTQRLVFQMDINPLANLRQAYEELERRVQRTLHTQVGDDERLAEVQEEVLSYVQAVEQVCRVYLLKTVSQESEP